MKEKVAKVINILLLILVLIIVVFNFNFSPLRFNFLLFTTLFCCYCLSFGVVIGMLLLKKVDSVHDLSDLKEGKIIRILLCSEDSPYFVVLLENKTFLFSFAINDFSPKLPELLPKDSKFVKIDGKLHRFE